MFEFFKNKFTDGLRINTKADSVEATIYRPNAQFEQITPAQSGKLCISLITDPIFLYGIKHPSGTYIAKMAYERLPEELKQYFSPETVTLEFS